jgi:hypothetical protein
MNGYLFDKEFLKELDFHREKETYVRVISLTNDELPVEALEGKIINGTINIDGASAVRRSCSLEILVENENQIFTDDYWVYNTKFKLEIGLKNNINQKYPDIIWFE